MLYIVPNDPSDDNPDEYVEWTAESWSYRDTDGRYWCKIRWVRDPGSADRLVLTQILPMGFVNHLALTLADHVDAAFEDELGAA